MGDMVPHSQKEIAVNRTKKNLGGRGAQTGVILIQTDLRL